MPRSENKKDKRQSSIRHQSNLKPINFCVPGILSKCRAGKTWIEHRHCRFAKKSEYSNMCIHYIVAINGHCDSIDAQRNAGIIVADQKNGICLIQKIAGGFLFSCEFRWFDAGGFELLGLGFKNYKTGLELAV